MQKILARYVTLLVAVCLTACGGANSSTQKSGTTGRPPSGAGALSFAAASYAVAQNAGTLTVSVARTNGSSGAVSVAYATVSDTAAAGADYTAAVGTLNWNDGDAADKTFLISISNSAPYSGSRDLTVQLSAAAGGATIGAPAAATITITGSAQPTNSGVLAFSAAQYAASQTAGGATISVARTGGSTGAASVGYSTADDTAAAGADYTATAGTLSWAAGDATAKSFVVPVSKTKLFVGTKSFKVALAAIVGATLGTPTAAAVNISGGAQASAAGVLALSGGKFTVAQAAGQVTVAVMRSNGAQGAVTVAYATANGTAMAGGDYTAAAGILSWADGDQSVKNVVVPISNATAFTGQRRFSLALGNPGGGASLGAPDAATITINGSTQPGSLAFGAPNYDIGQGAGNVVLTVNRVSGSSGAVSVRYATADGTASSPAQYTAATGTLNWAAGDTQPKSISVAVSGAPPFSGVKTFSVNLGNPTGSASLSTPSNATVTINGSSGISTSQIIGTSGAARLLGQATFGATLDTIAAAQNQTYDAWFAQQAAIPPSYMLPKVVDRNASFRGFWWTNIIAGPDQLRQRVAFALSEIFVVSGISGGLNGASDSQTYYYDILVRNALGNYRTLLEQVSLSPDMGLFLSTMRNDKPNAATGRHADENYAREIMQLFSVGLWELNPDGTSKLDGSGNPIPTYVQADVTSLARALTGWASKATAHPYGDESWSYDLDLTDPMVPYENHHDTTAKTIINGTVIPAGGTTAADLKVVLDTLYNHPNVGPFIGQQLIERLVTSNPSPAYVQRVAGAFNNNGQGVRGDLLATVKAVLTDPEATSAGGNNYGKLREPLIRVAALWRGLNAYDPNKRYDEGDINIYSLNDFHQEVLDAPTVFNFFRPDYRRAGILSDAGMVAPEFQITNENTMVLTENRLAKLSYQFQDSTGSNHAGTDYNASSGLTGASVLLHTAAWEPYAADPATLVDKLNLVLMAGQMSDAMKATLVAYAAQIPANTPWVRVAETTSLIVGSPQYAVQR